MIEGIILPGPLVGVNYLVLLAELESYLLKPIHKNILQEGDKWGKRFQYPGAEKRD